MVIDGSFAFLVLGTEVVGVGQGSLLIALVADVELLLVRGLVVNEGLGVDEFEILEEGNFAHLEGQLGCVALLDEAGVVD